MSVALRYAGSLDDLTSAERRSLLDRSVAWAGDIVTATAELIAQVRERGDAALREQGRRFDGATLDALEIPRARCRAALDALEPALRRALERSARNLAVAQEAFRPVAVEVETEPGVVIGRRPDPLGAVGIYAPGGRASYASSVLMGAVPARVAGVSEIVLCSPAGPDGAPSPVVLAAAALAGVDRVFAAGGAGAIAAMAYGTATIPRVDRIVGPGNAWVNEAKRQLAHVVATDTPAGPSELLVIADDASEASAVALEMIAQAEHDPRACVVAVAVGEIVARDIELALDRAVATAGRREIVRASLATRGGVLWTRDVADAIAFANAYAPEHLWLALASADELLPCIRHAGAVYVGPTSGPVLGDYLTGANHVLPTGGTARAWSGLSVHDFVRWTCWQRVTGDAAARLAGDTARFADAESLPGHASAARRWSTTATSVPCA